VSILLGKIEKKIAMFPPNTYFIVYRPMPSYGTLDYRYKRLVLNESLGSFIIATKVQTLNVMYVENMTVLVHLMDMYIYIYIVRHQR
jgi:hypothetical protein